MDERWQQEALLRAEIARLQAELLKLARPETESQSPTRTSRLLEFAPFAVENLSDATYVICEDASIVYVNLAACEMLGYAQQELLAMKVFDLNEHITPESWRAIWTTTVRDRRQTIISEHRRKDGQKVPVEILANAIDMRGVTYSCTFTRDITERRKLETRMRQAEKMEAIGQLAGGIAHDFNNQLAGIVGYADLLKDELQDRPDLIQIADAILTAAMRSAGLTRQLLAFARQGKNLSSPVDLHAIVGEVVEMMKRSIDKRIVIRSDLDAPAAVTIGDPSQLQNAVLNLAINARDAMPGGGTLTFSTRLVTIDGTHPVAALRQLAPGHYVQVSVGDTGIGMDADTQRRIFEPFFTTKEKGKGTGMGLPAVYGTINNHRGAIQVHSELAHGTVVDLYLPLALGSVPASELADGPEACQSIGARVLLVEDETAVRDMGVKMLNRLQCQVTTVGSGKEAIAIYCDRFSQFDVVILDLVMPEMSGKDTFRHLQQINPGIIAILTSGYTLDGEVQSILDAGAKGFLQKPFRAAELSRKLQDLLGTVPTAS
jgi:PAS domain S-box-containing protein